MQSSVRARGALVLAFLLSAGSLAACGGGGTGGATPSVTTLPSSGPTTTPATPPTTGPVTSPSDPVPPASEPPPADAPPAAEPPPPTTPIEPPEKPAALPAWTGLPDVRGVAIDPTDGSAWAVSAADGTLWRLRPGEIRPEPRGTLATAGVRGLTVDPIAHVLLAVVDGGGTLDDRLVQIDPDSLATTPIGTIAGHAGVEALAYHPLAGILFAVDTATHVLLSIDAGTADATVVGSLGAFTDVESLAPDTGSLRLFGVDRAQRVLVGIDCATATATRLADAPASVDGLGYDPGERRFLAASASDGSLSVYDPIGAWMDTADIRGLATDPDAGTLFGSYPPNGLIVRLDPATGWKQPVGYVPVPRLEGLAYDAATRTLYAVSSATATVYALSPDDAAVRASVAVNGAGTALTGLAGLAFGNGVLYASDRDQNTILRIEPATGYANVLGAPVGAGTIEGLDFDAAQNLLLGFSNAAHAFVEIDPSRADEARVVSQGAFARVDALAWSATDERLYGTASDRHELFVVWQSEVAPLGVDGLGALVWQNDTKRLLGFDAASATIVEIDPDLEIALPVRAWPGGRLDAMTFDPGRGVVFAVDGGTGDLYALDDALQATPVGAPGVLAQQDVSALAFVPVSGRLYAVSGTTGRLLVVDAVTGAATEVNEAGPGLGFSSIHAMVFDPATGMLLAVDRTTQSLLQVDWTTGSAVTLATVEPAHVGGMAMRPGARAIWLSDQDRLVRVDRFTGATVHATPLPPAVRGGTAGVALRLLWPRGDVRAAALDTLGVEVGPADQDQDLVISRRGRELYRQALDPTDVVTVCRFPPTVRRALAVGDEVTWGVGSAKTTFRVVADGGTSAALAAVLSHPTVATRSANERALARAWLLDRRGLYTEALDVELRTLARPSSRSPYLTLGLLRTLGHLGLLDTRLGATALGEARAQSPACRFGSAVRAYVRD